MLLSVSASLNQTFLRSLVSSVLLKVAIICLLNIRRRTGNKGLASLLDVELSSDIFQALEESACRAACRSTNRSAVLTCVVFAFAESGGCCVMRVFKQALGLLILKNKLFH